MARKDMSGADVDTQIAAATPAALDAVLRENLSAFVEKVFSELCPGDTYAHNWHLDLLADRLTDVAARRTRRLIINLPPRSLKSICVSVALPAWLLGRDPTARIIVVSYSDELTRKHARDCRTVMMSAWYRRVFPRTRLSPDKRSEIELVTTSQGSRYATSVGGTLTGRGADFIIIDDPMKAGEAMSEAERRRVNEWFDMTLPSRLDDKERGVIALVMQRLHEDDLAGHLMAKGGFEIVKLRAIATEDEIIGLADGSVHVRRAGEPLHPERESLETLQRIKRDLGSHNFAAQYQQDPVPAEGNIYRADWLARYRPSERPSQFAMIVQSWDTAQKIGQGHDYSVCTTWGVTDTAYHLLDVLRGRWEFPDLRRLVVQHVRAHRADTLLVEDAGSGQSLIQSLMGETRLNVVAIKPKLDKQTRAIQQTAPFEAGRVMLPHEATWLADLEAELLGFPNTRHDDQVDSIVQFLAWAAERELEPQPPVVMPALLNRDSYFGTGY